MAKGGARSGAGRKPGGKNTKSREIADRAASEGITPLEVMLKAMRVSYAGYEAAAVEVGKEEQAIGCLMKASEVAKDAAPYIHPRLASVDVKAKVNVFDGMSDDELRERLSRRLCELAACGLIEDAGRN